MPQVQNKQQLRSLEKLTTAGLTVDPLKEFSSLIYQEASRRNRVVKLRGSDSISLIAKDLRDFFVNQDKEKKHLTQRERELRAYKILLKEHFVIDKWLPPVESMYTSRSNPEHGGADDDGDDDDEMPPLNDSLLNKTTTSFFNSSSSGGELTTLTSNSDSTTTKKSPRKKVNLVLPPIAETGANDAASDAGPLYGNMIQSVQRKVLRGGFDMRLFRRFIDYCVSEESAEAVAARRRNERIQQMAKRSTHLNAALKEANSSSTGDDLDSLVSLLGTAMKATAGRRRSKPPKRSLTTTSTFVSTTDVAIGNVAAANSRDPNPHLFPSLTNMSEPLNKDQSPTRPTESARARIERDRTVYFSKNGSAKGLVLPNKTRNDAKLTGTLKRQPLK